MNVSENEFVILLLILTLACFLFLGFLLNHILLEYRVKGLINRNEKLTFILDNNDCYSDNPEKINVYYNKNKLIYSYYLYEVPFATEGSTLDNIHRQYLEGNK